MKKIAVCFICMGNICRSPTAEGVFRHMARVKGVEQQLHIDSAGTHGYHLGHSPDQRSAGMALKRGYDLSCIKSRRIESKDFLTFDYLLVMDNANLDYLNALKPPETISQIKLFMEFGKRYTETEVPDPYYGGHRGFEHVLDMIEDASEGFLEHVFKTHLNKV